MTRTIADDVHCEMKLRLLPIISNDTNSNFDVNLLQIETKLSGREIWNNVKAREIMTMQTMDSIEAEVIIICGKVGAGKTELARALLKSWLSNDESTFSKIIMFNICLLIDGEKLEKGETWHIIKSWLPDTISHWGEEELNMWLKSTSILLMVDDFLLDTGQEEQLLDIIAKWKAVKLILFTNLNDAKKVIDFVMPRSYIYFQFRIMNIKDVKSVAMAKKIKVPNIDKSPFVDVKYNITELFETFGSILYFFNAVDENICQHSHLTVTDVIWNMTHKSLNKIKDRYSLSESKMDEWLSVLCRVSYECLAGGASLLGEEVEPLQRATKSLFPELDNVSFLIEVILNPRPSLYNNEEITWCIQSAVQQEVYASWHVIQKCMEGIPMKRLLKKIECEDPFGIWAGGLLRKLVSEEDKFFIKFDTDPQKREKKIERIIKNLFVQTERSSEPISFIMRVLHEMQIHPLLTKLFLKESYIPPHLFIYDYAIYEDAIKAVSEHSHLSKIYFLVRKNHEPPQLCETLYYVRSLKIEVALALMNHLEWDSGIRSNNCLQMLNSDCYLKIVDFIGCLDDYIISKLHIWESTKYIVCLRVRVCNTNTAKILINSQNNLSCLMWLEIDFDFSLTELFNVNLPSIRTPLIDLSFCRVKDEDIENICNFLHSISNRYSGIHIHNSSVSPQGVMEILKYFYRKDMYMNADSKSISKYRKYRFTEMSSVDPKEEIDAEKTERLLGYDDRHHYSDNEVHSSYLANPGEVNALKTFFEIMTSIIYFKYSCGNYTVIKDTDGLCSSSIEKYF